jgi:outer membrane receptor protein involved in Fe transport
MRSDLISVAVFVNNVTNKYYYTNSLNALSALGTNSAQIGTPRMAGATVAYHF